MKYNDAMLGWEIHSKDENGKVYVKESFTYQFRIMCNGYYVIRDNKSATIYEGRKPKKRNKDIVLAKIYLEPTDALVVITNRRKYATLKPL